MLFGKFIQWCAACMKRIQDLCIVWQNYLNTAYDFGTHCWISTTIRQVPQIFGNLFTCHCRMNR